LFVNIDSRGVVVLFRYCVVVFVNIDSCVCCAGVCVDVDVDVVLTFVVGVV